MKRIDSSFYFTLVLLTLSILAVILEPDVWIKVAYAFITGMCTIHFLQILYDAWDDRQKINN